MTINICPVDAIQLTPVSKYGPAGENLALRYQFTDKISFINGMDRPGNFPCPCLEYSKDGLCDWPFRNGLTYEEIKKLREELRK